MLNFPKFCAACGQPFLMTHECPQNAAMAQSSKEKQQDYRARMALLGMSEVRGIYLPKELHKALKDYALKLLARDTAEKVAPKDKR